MQITGTTFTGCTLGPYYDPNILYGVANNQIGIVYDPLITLASSANNQIGIVYDPLITLASSANNQIGIVYNPLITLASSANNQITINTRGA